MNIETRPATLGDVDTLAAWNKQLIEDEGSRNPMNLQQLRDRMTGLLNGEWRAAILSVDGEETGYMLYKEGRDDYFPNQPTVYVRQFFIHRSKRSRGIGETAFNLIAKKHFPKGSELSLEVLESNPRGRGFWEKIGFQTYCTTQEKRHTVQPPPIATLQPLRQTLEENNTEPPQGWTNHPKQHPPSVAVNGPRKQPQTQKEAKTAEIVMMMNTPLPPHVRREENLAVVTLYPPPP